MLTASAPLSRHLPLPLPGRLSLENSLLLRFMRHGSTDSSPGKGLGAWGSGRGGNWPGGGGVGRQPGAEGARISLECHINS